MNREALHIIVMIIAIGIQKRDLAYKKLPLMTNYTETFPDLRGLDPEPLQVVPALGRTPFIVGEMGPNKPAYDNGTVYAINGDPSHQFAWVVSYPDTNVRLSEVQSFLYRRRDAHIPNPLSFKFTKLEVVRVQGSAGNHHQPIETIIAVANSNLTNEIVSAWKYGHASTEPRRQGKVFKLRLQTPSLPGLGCILFGTAYSPTEAYLEVDTDMNTKTHYVRLGQDFSRWVWDKSGIF